MEDRLGTLPLEDRCQIAIAHAGAVEPGSRVHIALEPGGKVVDHGDIGAALDQRIDQVRTNKARSPGNQDLHKPPPAYYLTR